MTGHTIALRWFKGDVPFTYDAYPRTHAITFKDNPPVMVSAAAACRGDPAKADPEDLLVAALSSCHMLSFLAICAKKRLTVLAYDDVAEGFLEDDGGRLWMTRVVLRPKVTFQAAQSPEQLTDIHHLAHQACFIANSVRTVVTVEPR